MKALRRIGAFALAVFLILMVVVTLVLAVTGSRYFMASLLITLGFPLLLYGYMIIYRSIGKGKNQTNQTNDD